MFLVKFPEEPKQVRREVSFSFAEAILMFPQKELVFLSAAYFLSISHSV